MDPGAEELDYGDDYGGAQKTRYQGGGAISALADDEVIGDDDEYDDLYNDVNVGENFQQMQQPVMQMASAPKANPPESNINIPESKVGLTADRGQMVTTDNSQQGRVMGINLNVPKEIFVSQGSNPASQKTGVDNTDLALKVSAGAAPVQNPGMGHNQTSTALNYSNNENNRPTDNGSTMLFVGELHWWTTDAEIESVLSQYGRVKDIKFFDERASGKSKGYCQVEFYDSVSASMCKEGMNGHVFNGRACVVAFASPQTIRQMGSSYANKNQTQTQTQFQPQGRRPMNDSIGRGGMNQQPNNGDGGRNYGGRGGWGRGGSRGPVGGSIRGRGGPMGGRNMAGSGPSNGAFGPVGGPAFGGPLGGMMNPQGMMGAGFDPNFMGRGGGYGGFPGPGYPGVMPSFPHVNPMGMTGVAPHVNPAFFGRGMGNNGMGMGMGMGMMGNPVMDGQQGMWGDTSMGGGEEYGQRTRESSYGGGEDGGSEYGYGDGSQEKGARSHVASREKEWGSERDERDRRHRDEREIEKERPERNHRYREENEDWDRGQSSSRSRSRSKAIPEEDYRRSRDGDYGKRRRLPSE